MKKVIIITLLTYVIEEKKNDVFQNFQAKNLKYSIKFL